MKEKAVGTYINPYSSIYSNKKPAITSTWTMLLTSCVLKNSDWSRAARISNKRDKY
jgi:hypothetical protein